MDEEGFLHGTNPFEKRLKSLKIHFSLRVCSLRLCQNCKSWKKGVANCWLNKMLRANGNTSLALSTVYQAGNDGFSVWVSLLLPPFILNICQFQDASSRSEQGFFAWCFPILHLASFFSVFVCVMSCQFVRGMVSLSAMMRFISEKWAPVGFLGVNSTVDDDNVVISFISAKRGNEIELFCPSLSITFSELLLLLSTRDNREWSSAFNAGRVGECEWTEFFEWNIEAELNLI